MSLGTVPAMTTTPQKITFGEMRASGVQSILICCRDHRCSHHTEISADRWPDNIRLSDVEPKVGGCRGPPFGKPQGI